MGLTHTSIADTPDEADTEFLCKTQSPQIFEISNNGKTTTEKFMVCILNDDVISIQSLLESGGNVLNVPETGTIDGYTPLQQSILYSRIEVMDFLLGYDGVNINAKSAQFGKTALMIASEHSDYDTVEKLISCGSNIEANDEDKLWRALHYATYSGNFQNTKKLLERGAYINCTDVFGQTPLHIAVFRGYTKICKLLLQKGADTTLRDYNGDTAEEIAESVDIREIFSFGTPSMA